MMDDERGQTIVYCDNEACAGTAEVVDGYLDEIEAELTALGWKVTGYGIVYFCPGCKIGR